MTLGNVSGEVRLAQQTKNKKYALNDRTVTLQSMKKRPGSEKYRGTNEMQNTNGKADINRM